MESVKKKTRGIREGKKKEAAKPGMCKVMVGDSEGTKTA